MFEKVVFATDGSPAADEALAVVRGLAGNGTRELTVVHCEELTMPGKVAGRFPVHADEDELQAKVRAQVAELQHEGLHTRLEIHRITAGGAGHVIAEVARDTGADLIVVGTRGHTPLGGLLVGSVTQRLLHIAPCPVLAVRSTAAEG